MYGLIPDTGRLAAFLCLVLLSILQLVAKGVATALLAVTNGRWLVLYFVADHAVYLIQKVLRGDLVYYTPMPSAIEYPAGLLIRTLVKVIVDFSGTLHFRNPYELGGIYFSYNLVMSQLSMVTVTYLYNEFAKDDDVKRSRGFLRWFTGSVIVIWILTFTYFLTRVAHPDHRRTFWSTRTGWKKTEDNFRKYEGDDAMRLKIFTNSTRMWSHIKGEVMDWTKSNWERWSTEKPAWFTPLLISGVPDDFIPLQYLVKLGGARERRGSAAGSVHESLKAIDAAKDFCNDLTLSSDEFQEVEEATEKEAAEMEKGGA
jgi:hypothetical protein